MQAGQDSGISESEDVDRRRSGLPGVVVVTHGRFAVDLVESARTIVGDVDALEAVSIDWNDPVEDATERIREALGRVDRGAGVLVLTDMFGGTPTNLALSMLEPGKLEIVTGVNLPMLIKFAGLREASSLSEVAARIAEQGRESIQVASRLLESDAKSLEGDGS